MMKDAFALPNNCTVLSHKFGTSAYPIMEAVSRFTFSAECETSWSVSSSLSVRLISELLEVVDVLMYCRLRFEWAILCLRSLSTTVH
jgi:hypothetical protein